MEEHFIVMVLYIFCIINQISFLIWTQIELHSSLAVVINKRRGWVQMGMALSREK
jgi:hypothetical protein